MAIFNSYVTAITRGFQPAPLGFRHRMHDAMEVTRVTWDLKTAGEDPMTGLRLYNEVK